MTSTMDTAPSPLKDKLNHVKSLLDGANKRLQEEASKYEVFATKTSGAPAAATSGKQRQDVPADLRRTITDISTIQSVLSCPIFGQIVNVTDSLDMLSYHLNLRPSIAPVDINIDSNGELILAPPIAPTSLNNLINSRLDDFENLSQSNQPRSFPNMFTDLQQQQQQQQQQQSPLNNGNGVVVGNGNGVPVEQLSSQPMRVAEQLNNGVQQAHDDYNLRSQDENDPRNAIAPPPSYNNSTPKCEEFVTSTSSEVPPYQQQREFGNEKLVSNGNDTPSHVNGNRRRRSSNQTATSKVQSVAAVFENHIAESSENRRLYKANGNFALNQMDSAQQQQQQQGKHKSFDSLNERPLLTKSNSKPTSEQSPGNENQQPMQATLGYTNDMYRTTHELTGAVAAQPSAKTPGVVDASMDYKKLSLTDTVDNSAYANNILTKNHSIDGSKQQRINQAASQRVSPSTSAGSTVPLADECDSGTSSFRSQVAKGGVGVVSAGGSLYSPQSHKPIPQLDEDSSHAIDSSLDQELIEKLSPDMERIKVTLEKDSSGLGITIAGYICEREEISGIFIKSITPGSPADRSGKVRILDQIFAVNGQEILGYSNAEAVNVLRSHTSRVVTLELMRYLAESKYRKLHKLLNQAEPSAEVQNSNNENALKQQQQQQLTGSKRQISADGSQATDPGASDLIKAQPGLGAASSRRTSQSSTAGISASPVVTSNPTTESLYQQQQPQQPIESMYNNTSVFYSASNDLQQQSLGSPRYNEQSRPNGMGVEYTAPVAAQRGASSGTSNKVIETKQGTRNTVDIRSPMCQTTPPTMATTYMNGSSNDMMATRAASSPNRTAAATAAAAVADRQKRAAAEEFGQLVKTETLEWERDVQIVELCRDSSQSLGFTVKDYANPKDEQQSIFMIVLITPGGIAERDGRLSVGDLLVFVDDTNLEGASPNEAVRALKRTSGHVRLGVLKYKRD